MLDYWRVTHVNSSNSNASNMLQPIAMASLGPCTTNFFWAWHQDLESTFAPRIPVPQNVFKACSNGRFLCVQNPDNDSCWWGMIWWDRYFWHVTQGTYVHARSMSHVMFVGYRSTMVPSVCSSLFVPDPWSLQWIHFIHQFLLGGSSHLASRLYPQLSVG